MQKNKTVSKKQIQIGTKAYCKCGKLATHHHRGRHYCEECAKIHSVNCKRRVMFWFTPNGAKISWFTYDHKPMYEAI